MPATSIALLRRLDQPLEILPPAGRIAADSIRVHARPAGDLHTEERAFADLVYSIDLPRGYEIRPADWRRLVDHPDTLGPLIHATVRHNVEPLTFEPLSDGLLRRAEASLRLALADLSRAFDLADVTVSPDDARHVSVQVSGDLKNGTRMQYTMPVLWSD